MLQKFALAFKTKTIEFFAEEDEEDEEQDGSSIPTADLEEVITGQRVVVLKPDPIPRPNPQNLVPSLLAAVSSFRAAYLQLQAAHSPFDPDAVRAADRAAVSHLHRLSDLKRSYYRPSLNPNPNPIHQNPSFLEAQVQENQTLLRTFETVFNRLQADIDRKDAEATALRQRLKDAEAANSKLERKLRRSPSPPEEKVEALLSVGFFDSVLRESCRSMHGFTKVLVGLMKKFGWDLDSAANSIYPNLDFAKLGHGRYAILSYICLGMFGGFDSDQFCCDESGIESNSVDGKTLRRNSLRQFIEHSTLDPLELISKNPDCSFATFCKEKYQQVVIKGMESSLFGNSGEKESCLSLLRPSNPLLEPFVNMASSLWALHKLARSYDPVVEIFQVGRGMEFSMVYMEDVVRRVKPLMGFYNGKALRPKVVFTVVPGFRVGKTVIQCCVYLDVMKEVL